MLDPASHSKIAGERQAAGGYNLSVWDSLGRHMELSEQKEWTIQLVEIATPCAVPWDSMCGDDRIRFCDQCAKNVYNISALSQAEATKLLVDNEGRVCISMLKRADGTVVTDECPPLLRPIRNGYRRVLAAASAVLALIIGAQAAKAGDDCPDGQQNKATKTQSPPAVPMLGEAVAVPQQSQPARLGGAPIPPSLPKQQSTPVTKPIPKPDPTGTLPHGKPDISQLRPGKPADKNDLNTKAVSKPGAKADPKTKAQSAFDELSRMRNYAADNAKPSAKTDKNSTFDRLRKERKYLKK